MRLEAVRRLKSQIRDSLVSRAFNEVLPEQPNFSVGVGLTDMDGKYKLAVRVREDGDREWFQEEYARFLDRPDVDVDIRTVGTIVRQAEEEVPELPSAADDLQVGMRVRHVNGRPGTLGFFAERNGMKGFVSCNHVIARKDRSRRGDVIRGGVSDAVIARLERVHRLKSFLRQADCAYAAVDPARFPADANILGPDGKLDADLPVLTRFLPVIKIGAATQRTTGRIISFENDDHVFDYDNFFATFPNVIEIESTTRHPATSEITAFSDPGDSGSLIYTEDRKPVGILFFETTGGPNNSGLAYANPIGAVLAALDVRIAA
jgi:hypothetical protein